MNKAEFRHELKYVLNEYEFAVLRSRIKYVLKRDTHTIGDTYTITSLYFDDMDDKAFYQKIDGDDNRQKYRIRCYNHDNSFIILERKDKINGLTRKASCRIDYNEYCMIANGRIDFIPNDTERVLLREFKNRIHTQALRPSQIVEYCREPYVYDAGNVRVTFDTMIKSARAMEDITDNAKMTVPAMANGIGILEVKYDDFIPEHIRDVIQVGNKMIQSNSKYVLCKIAMQNYK